MAAGYGVFKGYPEANREVAIFSVLLVGLSFGTYLLTAAVWNYLHTDPTSITHLLIQWDSSWYRTIIEGGYFTEPRDDGFSNWAFFPLYPASVWVFKQLTGLSTWNAGIVLSNLYLCVAVFYVYRYVQATRGDAAALSASILVALGPYSFYFSTLYSEALFAMLLAAAFYYLHRRQWLYCGILAGFLSATRGVGVLFGLAMLITMIGDSEHSYTDLVGNARYVLTDRCRLLSLLLVPTGLFLYMTYLYFHVGDALAFMHIQGAWAREFHHPLFYIEAALRRSEPEIKYLGLWGLVALGAAGYLLWTRRLAEGVFGLLAMAIPLSSGIYSIPRYAVGSLVIVFAINDLLQYRTWLKWLFLGGLLQSNILLVWLWYSHTGFLT